MRKTMKILAGVGLAGSVLVAASPGQAADIYREPPSIKDSGPVDYAPAITWTGFYVGGQIGATWPDDDLQLLNDDAQFVGGFHVGYNWQTRSNWVVGIEGDSDFGSDDFDYLASIRGRLGYAFGRTLIYGTGGVAFAGFNNVNLDEETGWVAGGGVETKVRSNISLGLEALYYNFDDASVGGVIDDPLDTVTVRGRLTYHMNGGREPLK